MAAKTTWIIDPGHSEVRFKIKHLAIANVNGHFKSFHGQVTSPDENSFDGAEVEVSLESSSLDTNHPQRDGHLKSPDFLDVENHPVILFKGLLREEAGEYVLEGELSIKGTSRSIRLDAELTGMGKGRFGDTRAGFEVKGKINRKDFGLTWNILAEGGGLVVGEDIQLYFDIELIKQ